MTANPSTPDPKLLARQRRAGRARRARRIRRGVAAGAVTLFVGLFSTIYVQMGGGHSTTSPTTTSSQSAASAVTTHQS